MPEKLSFDKYLIAGGGAGLIEVLLMYPLDLAKTRQQLSVDKSIGTFSQLAQIVREKGIFGMYRGILPPIFAEVPKRAIKFGTNEVYKPIFSKLIPNRDLVSNSLAGASAGATEAFANCPFEVVKVRLQAKENLHLYKNTPQCLVHILKNEGIVALYNGLVPQLLRNAVWNGIYFGMIPFLNKNVLWQPQSKSETMARNFIGGLIAGTLGTCANTPFDVVKSRMQNQKNRHVKKYKNTFQALHLVYKEEGFLALYKGLLPRIYRLGPGGGVMILGFDFISGLLSKQ